MTSKKIYFRVGMIRYEDYDDATSKTSNTFEDWSGDINQIQNKEFAELVKPRLNRLIKVYRGERYKEQGEYLVAEYDEDEIHKDDLKIINKHDPTTGKIVGSNEPIKYHTFIHSHFLEYLQLRKKRMLKNEGLIDLDDGTIFGRVSKTIQVPEETIVIPAHEKEIFVDWDCWEDTHETHEDLEDRGNKQ